MKKIMVKLYLLITLIFSINWIKTLYINFYMLSFGDAIKFPIIIYGKCRLKLRHGKITFGVPIKRGLLKIGHRYEIFKSNQRSDINIHGNILVNGETWFGTEVKVYIQRNATLTTGHMSSFGSFGMIICYKSITFSDYSRVGSYSYISDTNFHFIKDTTTNKIMPMERNIYLGGNNYIGSKVSILAGTVTPNNLIIGLGSICNKDYTKSVPEYSLIAGMPAKLLKSNIVRIFDFKKEAEISNFFKETGAKEYIDNNE